MLIACSYDGNIAAVNFSDIDLGHSLSFVEKDKLFKVHIVLVFYTLTLNTSAAAFITYRVIISSSSSLLSSDDFPPLC